MALLLSIAVFLLMVSVGMNLKLSEVVAHWRRLGWAEWLYASAATFIVPPALALLMANLFRLTRGETIGLFMVGAAPGAPLLTRNIARKGFDMQLAASYQLWAGLMVPVMIPIVVTGAAKIYGRNIWIPPAALLKQIAFKQFLPLILGIAIVRTAPRVSRRFQPAVNALGNILFAALVLAVLFKIGAALKSITPLVPVAAALLAIGSVAGVLLLPVKASFVKETFAICNANRHVGLALLLTGRYLHAPDVLPTIACYALLAPLIMFGHVKWHGVRTGVVAARRLPVAKHRLAPPSSRGRL